MTTGCCASGGGRPKVEPVVAPFAFLVERDKVQLEVHGDGAQIAFAPASMTQSFDPAHLDSQGKIWAQQLLAMLVDVPQPMLAHARRQTTS